MTYAVKLPSRSVLSVDGPDAETFLNGLLTQSTLGMAYGETRYGALLTPQGRVIADMFIQKSKLGFSLDCARVAVSEVERRLRLFKLKSRVTIFIDPSKVVLGFSGETLGEPASVYPRTIAETDGHHPDPASFTAFETARIRTGRPEQGVDFGVEDVYPSDINMDLSGGVDFKKGCYVGQEVVSRMKRRASIRRRTVVLDLSEDLDQLPSPVFAGGEEIGRITSKAGGAGLARIRTDRLMIKDNLFFCETSRGRPLLVTGPAQLLVELGNR